MDRVQSTADIINGVMASMSQSTAHHSQPHGSFRRTTNWLTAATIVSAVGTSGSLFLSVGLGLKACPLCFYQRSFIMSALAVLALGRILERSRPGLICFLCVPLTWAGLGVAAFHEYLVLADILECPQGMIGLGTSPAQSFAIFIALAGAVTAGAWCGREETQRQNPSTLFSAVLLGFVFAAACVKSSPPLPPVPTAAYDPVKQPLDTCRRPFSAPKN